MRSRSKGNHLRPFLLQQSIYTKPPHVTCLLLDTNHNIEYNNVGNQSLHYVENPAIKRESTFLCDNRIDGDARSNCKLYHWTGCENLNHYSIRSMDMYYTGRNNYFLYFDNKTETISCKSKLYLNFLFQNLKWLPPITL